MLLLRGHPKETPACLLYTNCPLFLLCELFIILSFLLFTCDMYFKSFRFIFFEEHGLGGFYKTLVVWVIGFEYTHPKATQEANNIEKMNYFVLGGVLHLRDPHQGGWTRGFTSEERCNPGLSMQFLQTHRSNTALPNQLPCVNTNLIILITL